MPRIEVAFIMDIIYPTLPKLSYSWGHLLVDAVVLCEIYHFTNLTCSFHDGMFLGNFEACIL